MGRDKSRTQNYLFALLTCVNALFLSVVMVSPYPIFAMGTSYEDCTGHNMKEINRIASESLYLTKKIQYEARKNPHRLKKTITVVDKIEKDLNSVKSMTASRDRNTDYLVGLEMERFVREGPAQTKDFQDAMGLLFYVFRESIQDTNADKQYWINKLNEMNDIGEALGNYLSQLNDAARETVEQCGEKTQRYDLQKQQVPDKPVTGR